VKKALGECFNNSIYFAKGQVHQKSKSLSKLAIMPKANKQNTEKSRKEKTKLNYKRVDKPASYSV